MTWLVERAAGICYSLAMIRVGSLACLALLFACQREPRLAAQQAPAKTTAGATAPAPQPQAQPPSDGDLGGKIVETMDAGGYTYARIERAGDSVWVAGPQARLAVGMQLGSMHGMAMENFHSNTLNRTFATIYFVDRWPGATAAAAAPHAAAPHAAAPAPAAPAAEEAADLSGKVVETMNAAGYTYAKLDQGGKQLWIAGPETKLAVGTELGAMQGNLMSNFHSNTLNRTFDQIYFVSAFTPK